MLISKTWTLSPTELATFPHSYHLALVKQLHEQLSLPMGQEKIPAVSFSGFLGKVKASKEYLTFFPEETYQLRICGLNSEAASQINHFNLGSSAELLGSTFQVLNQQQERSSYEEIYTTLVAEEPIASRELQLTFVTPTAFSQKNLQLPLPVPTLMFQSWLHRWNYFAPIYLGGDELLEYLSYGVKIKQHRLKTRNFKLPKGYVTGFTGTVTLQVPYYIDDLVANVAHLLCVYSSFAATGMKTRLGMGQTELSL